MKSYFDLLNSFVTDQEENGFSEWKYRVQTFMKTGFAFKDAN